MATCTVSGTFTNPQGGAVSGATVRFNTQKPLLDIAGNLLMPKEIMTTTATDGTWSLAIAQSIDGTLTLDLNPTSNSPVVKYSFSLVIPSSTTATFASCWVDSGSFGGQSAGTSPLTFAGIAGVLATAQLPALPSADVWVGNGSSLATAVALSGDASLSNAGALTINSVGGSSSSLIHSSELLANAATNVNTPSTLVKRDASGNFSAGTITASLSGNASTATSSTTATTATTATSFTGSLTGDVSGGQSSTAVNTVGGSAASDIHLAEVAANAATNLNTVSTIVKRDGSGNFTAGTVTANLTGNVTGNLTGNVTGNVTGTVTGHSSLDLQIANNLSDVASTTTAFATIAPTPGTSGNVLTSNGSAWVSQAAASGPSVNSAIALVTAFQSFS